MPDASQITPETQAALTKSYSSAEVLAERYPQYAEQIIAAARNAFLDGDDRAYLAAILVVCAGAVVVFFFYPHREKEKRLLAEYATERAQ